MVGVYASMRSELRTAPLVEMLLARGTAVAFPRVVPGQLRLEFHRVGALADLEPGCFSIPEPTSAAPIVPVTNIDLFVVPGIAFDASGNRLGWGAGHYDVTLAAHTRALRVGFCFECQVVDVVPSTSTDLPMDLVVTEQRVLRPGRSAHGDRR
jgi:5-formyltetrahydrofolate cyclo-ligase